MSARPVCADILERNELPGGGARIRVPYSPPKLYRWVLRTNRQLSREYDLDPFGLALLEMCDGQKNVRYIIKQFIKTHGLNEHEAEQAVVAFLRTLIRKGIVTMVVPKP